MEEKPLLEKQAKKSKKEPELSLLQEVEAAQAHLPSENVDVSPVPV